MGISQRLTTIVVLTCVCAVVAELNCFIGEEICNKWRGEDEAEHGKFNGKDVCCPPEPHQSIMLNTFLEEPENCKCQAGTPEKYANVGSSAASSKVAGRLRFMRAPLRVFNLIVEVGVVMVWLFVVV